MGADLCHLSIGELGALLREKKVSASEVLEAHLKRVETLDPKVGAFLHVNAEQAMAQARHAQELLDGGRGVTALTGIPVGIKDVIVMDGTPSTAASRILSAFKGTYDATVVRKLHAAGAVCFGKLNMDEFAMGSSTENSSVKKTLNPWDLDCVPGGSSGGSAAAVAAGFCPVSIGSDTGGSIRQPAAFCGVVGLKPTYGRVSRFGVIAFASSLDQLGPFARTVADAAHLLEFMSGFDDLDSTSVDRPVPNYAAAADRGVKGLRLGVPKEYFIDGMDAEVEAAVRGALAELEKQGAKLVEVSLPHTKYAVATYYIVATAEASSNLARYDGVRFGHRAKDPKDIFDLYVRSRGEGFGPEVKRRIMLGTFCLSSGYYDAYYRKAQQLRWLIRQDFLEAFKTCDAIVSPVTPTAAFRFGEKAADPIQMYLSDIFTISCNLAGLPGVSVPCGFTSKSLPVGLQVLARHFAEETLVQVGGAYERATDWHKRRPAL
ncbi:MAG: Asp-tRNA(Asn)/Glu-tRNA(Gln) amidotransferase subunit GatA [Deltaproteobacteria bacterium]|nr:Asp-tRNA(Asn)/Glu-tRNA(Gln) amidotransferase subunit GatA [Deltaproteobacteria bacterium]